MKYPALFIDLIFLIRPVVLIPVWGFCIFGYAQGMAHAGSPLRGLVWTADALKIFAWFALFSLSVGAVHVLNQLADIDVDKENGGMPLLAKGKVSLVSARVSTVVCLLCSVIAPLFVHPILSIFSCCTVALGYFYSFKPVRFSGRVGFDFLANATGYGIIAFGVGWYFSGAPFSLASFTTSAFPYFCLMCAGSISSTIPDINGDKKYGKNTTAVVLGVTKAHSLAFILLSLALVFALGKHDIVAVICALSALPFYMLFFVFRRPLVQESTYKIGGFLCMIAATILMPVFGISAYYNRADVHLLQTKT